MNLKNRKKFYIIDFSAGNLITHHLNYAIVYSKFFKSIGYEYEIFTPKYLNSPELEFQFKVNKILISRYYRILERKFNIWSIYYKCLRVFGIFGRLVDRTLGKLQLYYCIYVSYKRIAKTIDTNTIEIIFPSTDLMAILLVKKMLKRKASITKFHLRLNSIDKNLIDTNLNINGLEILEDLMKTYSNITLGCETKILIDTLISRNEIFNKALWVPLPSITMPVKQNKIDIYGFLGGAKKRKGFKEIPLWIEKISNIDKTSFFLVQKSPFIWPGYLDTIKVIKHLKNVELLAPILSNSDFFLQIQRCSYLVAPYDPDSYKLVGSSLFYYAADSLIPTITYTGVGFSQDITAFNCGIIVKNFDANLNLGKITKKKLQNNLINYNIFRNKQNLLFFNILPIA